MLSVQSPAALVVGHPGHELRLFRWLELEHPVVFVLTDGSGGGRDRTASTYELLRATGSTASPMIGAFTDADIYEDVMRRDVTRVAKVVEVIADSLATQGVRTVVADAFELYNPTHDLCAVIATLAAALTGREIDRLEYPVVAAPVGEGLVIDLTADDVERKLAAAYGFENLTADVNELMRTIGRDGIARELIRPARMASDLPALSQKPFYEMHGEKRVAEGRYREVLRYHEHFVPFVRALAAAVGKESLLTFRGDMATA